MVDAAATSRGLLAMAFAPRDGAGLVQIVSTSPLALLLQLPLESVPMALRLKGVPGNEHFLTIGFEVGGVEVWSLTPKQRSDEPQLRGMLACRPNSLGTLPPTHRTHPSPTLPT